MHGISALLVASALAFVFARLLRLPAVPLLLLAGVGLSGTEMVPPDMVEDALILGASFLLFVTGLELDPRKVRAQRRAAVLVGTIQFGILAILGFAAARGLGFGPVESGYVALVLTASSTFVGVRILQQRQQMFEPFGRLVIGVLLLQDLLVLLFLPWVGEVLAGGGSGGWADPFVLFGALGILGVMAWVIRSRLAPIFLKWSNDTELQILGALAILFVFLGVSGALGIPIVAGAFMAGAALSRFPVSGIVRSELAPVGDFFTAIFFTALGALMRIPTGAELAQAAVLVAVVVIVTPPLVAVVATRAGFTTKGGIEAGLLLAQTSEISLVVGLAGRIDGVISESLFVVIALVTLTTMILTPFLATSELAARLAHGWPGGASMGSDDRSLEGARDLSDHVLLLGAGSTGMSLVEDLVLEGLAVAVIDDDPSVIARLREAGVHSVRGEATDLDALEMAGARKARAIISTIRRPRDNAVLLELLGGGIGGAAGSGGGSADGAPLPVLVRVFEASEAAWVEAMGGIPVLYSRATADELMEWYEAAEAELEASLAARGVRANPP